MQSIGESLQASLITGTTRRGLNACDGRAVVVVQPKGACLHDLPEMPRVSRADDDARHAVLIEHPAERHRADTHLVARRYLAERGQHVLEALPSTELLDDQPVLDERSILERRRGIGAAQIPV